MSKFKVGDKVKVSLSEVFESELGDIEADLLSSLNDKDITGKAYGAMHDAIQDSEVFTVSEVDTEESETEAYYGLNIEGHELPCMVPEKLLVQ